MTETASDVLIIGAGIMGSSTAFFLRQRGRSVTLLERGFAGAQASGVNFGNVRRQGRFLPQLPLAHRSREIWGKLPVLIDDDCEFLLTGHLKVAYTEAEAAELESYRLQARDYGLELELSSANALRVSHPWLGPDALCASFSPHDGHANPRLTAPAFARAAARSGATVCEHEDVVDIARSGEDFLVETKSARRYRAPALLVTAGAWAPALSARFGEPVPLVARSPQMAVTEPVPYFIKPVVGTCSGEIYMRQIPRGNVIFGGGARGRAHLDTIRAYVDPHNTARQLGSVCRLVPSMAAVSVIRSWGGIEGYMPDDIPIMGPSATTPGLFYAFGFCGHGFQLGPGVGSVMAELIDTGASATPIDCFSIARFKNAPGVTPPPANLH